MSKPAGWYEDTLYPGVQRWWTGDDWADVRRPKPAAPAISRAGLTRTSSNALVVGLVLAVLGGILQAAAGWILVGWILIGVGGLLLQAGAVGLVIAPAVREQ